MRGDRETHPDDRRLTIATKANPNHPPRNAQTQQLDTSSNTGILLSFSPSLRELSPPRARERLPRGDAFCRGKHKGVVVVQPPQQGYNNDWPPLDALRLHSESDAAKNGRWRFLDAPFFARLGDSHLDAVDHHDALPVFLFGGDRHRGVATGRRYSCHAATPTESHARREGSLVELVHIVRK